MESIRNIGIVDFDLLTTKQLCYYNFGILLLSSYYLERGIKPRLILNLSYDNLKKYEKIYIFKDYKTSILPINVIQNFYSLPIEEYGEGIPDAPSLPPLDGLIYTKIKTDIYKPLLFYIEQGGKTFTLKRDWPSKYYPTKIFFEGEDGEVLLRDMKNQGPILVYDEPTIFFNTEEGQKKMTELLEKCKIRFVKPIHIGVIEPKFYDTLFKSTRIINIKENLYAYHGDPYLKDFVDWLEENQILGYLKVAVKTSNGVKWIRYKGGRIYGNYRFKDNDEEGPNGIASKENLSVRNDWFATKRSSNRYQRNRDRASEEERRKYLPSELSKRRKRRQKLKRKCFR